MLKNRTIVLGCGLLGLFVEGCVDPCIDDGLGQEEPSDCPAITGVFTGGDESGGEPDTCINGVRDGDESDVDCGGSCPAGCGVGQGCGDNSDCASNLCTDGVCREPGDCGDGVQGGAETDVDCGGPDCDPCDDGEGCNDGSDCMSGVCNEDGTCAPPSCSDGVRNGDETDVDCGGDVCDGCDDGDACVDGDDCQSGICGDDMRCSEPACDDGVQNGDETDVDCGGSCGPCLPGDDCDDGADCESGVCEDGSCVPAACDDGVLNGSETDLDCGGECGSTCETGEDCLVFLDCVSLQCGDDLTCTEASCTDGAHNGDETDVDCGGDECDPCDEPGYCDGPEDCESGICDEGICVPPECDDTVQNGAETDVDCGGPQCAGCDDGESCLLDSDCLSLVCDPVELTCTGLSCEDGVQNGNETDVDCGGPDCDPCDNGDGCEGDDDCQSGECDLPSGQCEDETCVDLVQNGNETDVDCGGPDCAPCDDGDACEEGADCLSEFCEDDACVAPTCDDGVRNGLESDIDCGGEECPACDTGDDCVFTQDCASMVCLMDECQEAACDDGVRNGDETDTDCGGSCQPCDDGEDCVDDDDCVSMVCDPGTTTCAPPDCDDGVQNGDETDTDCGNSCGSNCQTDDGCDDDTDCVSMVCDPVGLTCNAPACDDNVLNGTETDTDCGGSCPGCDTGEDCVVGDDCISGGCDGSNTCVPNVSVVAGPSCAEYDGVTPVQLNAVASDGSGSYTYSWSPAGSLDDATIPNPQATPAAYESYTVTVDDGYNQAQDSVLTVIPGQPLSLENECTLYAADFGASAPDASITYDMGGSRACEANNADFGLHLCEGVQFEETSLVGTLEVTADGGDDDIVGLVWGAQDNATFYSLAWKQADQAAFFTTDCATYQGGITVKRIEAGSFAALTAGDMFCPNDTAGSTLLAAPAQTTTAGWEEGEAYEVTIDHGSMGSDVTVTRVSDSTEIASFSVADTTYPSGFFGSTTFSQADACVGPLFASCL